MKFERELRSIRKHAEEIIELTDKLKIFVNTDTKQCIACRKLLPKGEFYFSQKQKSYGSRCRKCETAVQSAKYQNQKKSGPKKV